MQRMCGFASTSALLLLGLLMNGVTLHVVQGTHFRHGQMTWKLVGGTTDTVEFTVDMSYQTSSFIGTVVFAFGDGDSITLSAIDCDVDNTGQCYDLLSQTTDLSGDPSTYTRHTFTHTYDSPGPWTYGDGNCCRVGGLVGGGGSDPFNLFGVVDLNNGNTGSPISSISPILQFPNGVSTTFDLLPVDNDGDTVTCRKATTTESGIPLNAFYTLDETTCQVTMGVLGTVGDNWAVQIIMESSGGDSVPLDFMFEATDPNLMAPVCSLVTAFDDMVNDQYLVNVGETLMVEMEGTDADSYDLTVTLVAAPAGGTVDPEGSGNNVPVDITFEWTPDNTQVGAFAASVQVQDGDSQTALCIIPIFVSEVTCDLDFLDATGHCSMEPNCEICNNDVCCQCMDDYFKLSNAHSCQSCQDTIPNCNFCQDFNGCGQCADDYYRVFNEDCGLWVCEATPCANPYNHCTVCDMNDCCQCESGYVRKWASDTHCVQCQYEFGSACMHCSDFIGCQQCQSGYTRTQAGNGLYHCY